MTILELYQKLEKEYPGWLDFEPETIRDFDWVKGNELIFNQIMALQTILVAQSDDKGVFFTDWRLFEKVVLTFDGVVPDFHQFEEAEAHEIHRTVNILKKIKGSVEFNDEVTKYIAAAYMTENIVYCPFYRGVDGFLIEDDLKVKVREIWNKISKLSDPFKIIERADEDAVSVQIKRLLYIKKFGDLL